MDKHLAQAVFPPTHTHTSAVHTLVQYNQMALLPEQSNILD